MKPTVEQEIIARFRELYITQGFNEFVNGGEVERKIADKIGRKPSTVARTLRDMTENNQGQWLEKEERKCLYSNVKTVWYKYKPSKYDEINRLNN